MRVSWPAVLLIVLSSLPASAQVAAQPDAGASSRPAGDYDRFHEFIHNTIKSPAFHVEAFGAGLIDQANHFPREWDDEGQPFLKRNVARFGQAFTASVVEASVARAAGYHVGYERCECDGGLRRLGHAVVHTFVVSRVDGGLVVNTPFLVSRYTAAAVANAWYPSSYTASDVVAQGTASLGTAVGLNILDEFGPDILRIVHLH